MSLLTCSCIIFIELIVFQLLLLNTTTIQNTAILFLIAIYSKCENIFERQSSSEIKMTYNIEVVQASFVW